MKIGKVPNDLLADIIKRFKPLRDEVVVGPGIGKDIAALDMSGDVTVLSSDPITSAGKNAGKIAVFVACNDIAACGAKPVGILTTILLPPRCTKRDLMRLTDEIGETCARIGIDVIGGHTEITDSVNRPVIISTAVGKVSRGKIITSAGAKPGDSLVMTKSAGLEGTSIIASDLERKLKGVLDAEALAAAKGCVENISVISESAIAADHGANAMHDITEGGVLGAVWEICEASGTGAVITEASIPVTPETTAVCAKFDLDPLKLISSGSLMITTADAEGLIEKLNGAGINAAVIGKICNKEAGITLRTLAGKTIKVSQPGSDEIYKLPKH